MICLVCKNTTEFLNFCGYCGAELKPPTKPHSIFRAELRFAWDRINELEGALAFSSAAASAAAVAPASSNTAPPRG